jgi:hypothetical protein
MAMIRCSTGRGIAPALRGGAMSVAIVFVLAGCSDPDEAAQDAGGAMAGEAGGAAGDRGSAGDASGAGGSSAGRAGSAGG